MLVLHGALPGPRSNLVVARSQDATVQASIDLRIAARHAHWLGPAGDPQAAGPADHQTASLLAGQPYCFVHTLLNTGNASDAYTLEAVGLGEGMELNCRFLTGGSLPQPITLSPGADLSLQACLAGLPASTTPFEFSLLAHSQATNATDSTANRVSQVWDLAGLVLRKSSSPGLTATAGERLVYTLHLENPLPVGLDQASIGDLLDSNLEFVGASHGGVYHPAIRTVRWNLSLNAVSTTSLSLETRVRPDALDAAIIRNRSSLRSAAIYNPRLVSNAVTLSVQAAIALLLEKQAQPSQVNYGDLVTYTISLANVGQAALSVNLEFEQLYTHQHSRNQHHGTSRRTGWLDRLQPQRPVRRWRAGHRQRTQRNHQCDPALDEPRWAQCRPNLLLVLSPIFSVVLSDPIPFFTLLVQNSYGAAGEVELACPDGSLVRPDLGSVSSISLDLAALCLLGGAAAPGGGAAPALLPGQGGYFLYRVQIR